MQSVIRWATRHDSPEPDERHLSIHMVDKDKDKAGQRPTHRQGKDRDRDEDEDKVQSVIRWATRRDSPEPDKRHLSIHMVIFWLDLVRFLWLNLVIFGWKRQPKTKTKTNTETKTEIKNEAEGADQVQSVIRWATRRDSPGPDKKHLSVHLVIFG